MSDLSMSQKDQQSANESEVRSVISNSQELSLDSEDQQSIQQNKASYGYSGNKIIYQSQSDQTLLSFIYDKPRLRHNPDLPKRLYEFAGKREERLEKLKEKYENRILEECTFRPSINPVASCRTFSEFWNDQVKLDEERQQKLSLQREQRSKIQDPFHPQINSKSEILAIKHKVNAGPLYKTNLKTKDKAKAKVKDSPSAADIIFSFTPRVNDKSKKIERDDEIGEHLYKDAVRRQIQNRNRVNNNLNCSNSNQLTEIIITWPKKFNRNTRFLKKKFEEDYNRIFEEYKFKRTNSICYSLYIVLLQRLRFIRNEIDCPNFAEERYLAVSLWDSMEKYNILHVNKEILYQVLLDLMGFTKNKLPKYQLLYENTKIKPQRKVYTEEYPFRPELSSRTHKLAQSKRSEREKDFLVEEMQVFQEKRKKLRMDEQQKEIYQHPFTPQINKPIKPKCQFKKGSTAFYWNQVKNGHDRAIQLYKLSNVLRDNPRKEFFEDLSECTFHPNTNRTNKTEKEQELSQDESEMSADKSDTLYESGEDEEPLTISITLPNGNVEYLIIHNNEDKSFAVDQFIVKHKLSGNIARQLKEGVLNN